MGYTLDELAEILGKLVDEGIDFVVIGDTVVQLELKTKTFEGDIDIYALEPSPLAEEERYMMLAEKYGWDYGSTEIGTPRLIARTRSGDIVIEVYESFMDIEIPWEIVEEARSINLRGVKIKVIKPEHYFVLKARQGVDLDKLEKYYKKLKSLDQRVIIRAIKYFPEEEQGLITSRLRNIGLKI